MKSAASFVVALAVAVVALVLLKRSAYGRFAWLYVAVILLGIAIYNRAGITTALTDLQNKMKGG